MFDYHRKWIGDVIRSAFPRDVVVSLQMRRNIRYWSETGLIFIHVPKSAGVSIATAIYGRPLGHYVLSDVLRFNAKRSLNLPTFAVTRNPWSRLVSAYNFVKVGQGSEGASGPMIAFPRRYKSEMFASFDTFVREWLPERDLAKEDFVFRPQCPFLYAGSTCVDFVGRFENITETEAYVSDIMRKSVKFDKLNRSRSSHDYMKLYNSTTKNIVADIYAEDIRRFNYDF